MERRQDRPPAGDADCPCAYSLTARLLRLCINPELYFGDAYCDGDIKLTGDLVQFLEQIYRGMSRNKRNWLQKLIIHWQAKPRRNSLHGSKENIHQHYDIGNEFYSLWLDNKMLYTCAYFPSPEGLLEQAQEEKMHHIARKLLLKPGETVVEAGCGWGSLALHLARHYGVKVHAYNISHQQIVHARQRALEEGLDNLVTFIEDDYRNIQGKFDAFVSVGMLEHVGVNHFEELGEIIKRCLKEDGRGLIHSIGRNQPVRMNAWIERRIFPGAYPPTLRESMDIFEPSDFSVLDVENIRLHYALTLRHWLERYEENTDTCGRCLMRNLSVPGDFTLPAQWPHSPPGNCNFTRLFLPPAQVTRSPGHVTTSIERKMK